MPPTQEDLMALPAPTDLVPGLSFEPLTPTAYLDRAAEAHGDRVAVVDGTRRWTYTELRQRCRRLAGGLAPLAAGSPVAVLCPNTHVLLEASFGVPWAGVPLVAVNTRLAAAEIAYILEHSEASVLVHDTAFDDLVADACGRLADPPLRIRTGEEYEALLAGAPELALTPDDERALLSINYTSGTTGRPKGVMYHHRGAYLQTLAMVAHVGLNPSSVYLWTLPMFHCNGWTFPWAVTAAGGTHVCLPAVDPAAIWRLIRTEGVTHLCGAPTVLSMIGYAPRPATGSTPRHRCTSQSVERRPARRSCGGWASSASPSPTSAGSPRPTALRCSATGARSGTPSTARPGPGCRPARAWAT